MTGRGQGPCNTTRENVQSRFWGFGGFGRGWRNRFFASGLPGRGFGRGLWRGFASDLPDRSSREDLPLLEDEAKYLEKELKNVQEEIKRLNKGDEDK
jgi:hypothetical protein